MYNKIHFWQSSSWSSSSDSKNPNVATFNLTEPKGETVRSSGQAEGQPLA
jgi:hypothetical protein